MDFETLCYNLFHIKKPFKKDGSLSKSGNRAYGKLLNMFYDMEDLGLLEDCTAVLNKLDARLHPSSKMWSQWAFNANSKNKPSGNHLIYFG